MPVKFGCPGCQSRIKISSKTPTGTPVKCPTCGLVFPNPPHGRKHRHRNGERSSVGLKLKRMILVALLILVLGASGAGAFFLVSRFGGSGTSKDQAKGTTNPAATGKSTAASPRTVDGPDPLAYIPSDANVIVGLSGAGMAAHPPLKALLEQTLTQLGLEKTVADCKKETGLELADLCATTIIALKMPVDFGAAKPESLTVVLKSSAAFDPKKLGQWASDGPPKKVKDKDYYDKHKDMARANTVYLPSDRIVVLSDIAAPRWDALFAADGTQPALPADALALVRRLDKNPFWAALPFDARTRSDIQAGKGPAELGAFLPADAQPAFKKALTDAKGLAAWCAAKDSKLELSLGLLCAADAGANDLTTSLQAAWGKNKADFGKGIDGAKDLPADLQALAKDLLGSLQFTRQDSMAVLSLQGGPAPVAQLVKEGTAALQKNLQELVALAVPKPVEKPVTLSPDETTLLDLVNKFRKEKNKPPLKPSAKLFDLARAYAALMAKEAKQDDELDGKDTTKRVKDSGYKVKKGKDDDMVTANITGGLNLPPFTAFMTWSEAAASSANLVDAYEEAGIGIGKNDKGEVFYYMIYATPDK